MSPQPHEGPAEQECLSGSAPPVVTEIERDDGFKRLLSGFSHRCRNSLNGIKMSLYLFRREARGRVPPYWAELENTYQQLESLFDHLQLIYRPMTLTMVRGSLGELIGAHQTGWRAILQSKERVLELDPPDREVEGDFDPIQLGIGLDALARWRAESGESKWHTRVSWRVLDGFIEICWEEFPVASSHIPALSAPRPGFIVDPKAFRRADSLVVLLVARILAAHGGRLEKPCETSLRWTMHWPQYHY
jgi:hypothetical protein